MHNSFYNVFLHIVIMYISRIRLKSLLNSAFLYVYSWCKCSINWNERENFRQYLVVPKTSNHIVHHSGYLEFFSTLLPHTQIRDKNKSIICSCSYKNSLGFFVFFLINLERTYSKMFKLLNILNSCVLKQHSFKKFRMRYSTRLW